MTRHSYNLALWTGIYLYGVHKANTSLRYAHKSPWVRYRHCEEFSLYNKHQLLELAVLTPAYLYTGVRPGPTHLDNYIGWKSYNQVISWLPYFGVR